MHLPRFFHNALVFERLHGGCCRSSNLFYTVKTSAIFYKKLGITKKWSSRDTGVASPRTQNLENIHSHTSDTTLNVSGCIIFASISSCVLSGYRSHKKQFWYNFTCNIFYSYSVSAKQPEYPLEFHLQHGPLMWHCDQSTKMVSVLSGPLYCESRQQVWIVVISSTRYPLLQLGGLFPS